MNTPIPSSTPIPSPTLTREGTPSELNGHREAFQPKYASRMELVRPSDIRALLILGNDPSIISFGGGFPDATLFPAQALAKAFADALAEEPQVSLQYTATAGILPLRQQIAKRAQSDGMACDPDDVLVLQGGQQGLDLVSKMVCDRGDKIIVENPTFLGGLAAFNPYQPEYLPVNSDIDGILTEELEMTLRANPDAKLIYIVPDFSNPTGITLSLARRKEVVALAVKFGILILEDTPYRALRFSGSPIPTLYSLCPSHVVHLGSFSKVLAPGLRLGYAIASPPILDKLALLKMAADTQSSTINQSAVVRFLETQDLDLHIERLCEAYRKKRDAMEVAIKKYFPASVHHTHPEGGLFLWVTFPESFNSTDFLARSALPLAKVAYVPSRSFFARGDRQNSARFSYSSITEEQIASGIKRLGALLKESGL